MLTTAEAALLARCTPAAFRKWASRRDASGSPLVAPAGRDPQGRPLYAWRDVLAARERARARNTRRSPGPVDRESLDVSQSRPLADVCPQ